MNNLTKVAVLSAMSALMVSAPLADASARGSGSAIAAGVAGLAVGAILSGALSQPSQPQIIYQAPPPPRAYYPARRRAYYPDRPRAYYPDRPRAYYSDRPRAYYSDRPRAYYPAAPAYYPPERPAYRPVYEPWSPAWRDYCSMKYRSFNPYTGTYRGYDGLDHFCNAN